MYTRPDSLEDALASLAEQRRVVLAGGTDFYPARVGRPIDDPVLDISRLEDLRVIHDEGDHFRIGALATWTDVIRSPLPPWFDGLKLAAREVGGVQIQNVGTVGGNVCNASPAADGVPNLLVLDARVELQSVRGARTLALSEFLVGNRQTDRAPDELVTAIVLPKPPGGAASTFLKLGARRYLVISIVMVAGLIARAGGGRVVDARVAVGSCSTVAQRLTELESDLCGRMADPHLSDAVAPEHLAPLSPIDDVRGTAAYRVDATLTLLRRRGWPVVS